MSVRYEDWLKEQLEDAEFRREYEAIEAEEEIVGAVIDARELSGLTESELAERAGVSQSDIEELESGQS